MARDKLLLSGSHVLFTLAFISIMTLFWVLVQTEANAVNVDMSSLDKDPSETITTTQGAPHVVLVVLDSIGKGDLFTSEDRMGYSTPNLNKIAALGAVLRNFYVQPESSPTRASLMTGKYPFKLGMQEQLVSGTTAHLPLNVPILPELLQASQSYENHLIGGWGLGGARVEYTPTYRGFGTFYGFLGSEIDYYNKTRGKGIDFWDEVAGQTKYKRAAWSAKGNYSTYQFQQRTKEVLESYVRRKPSIQAQQAAPLFLMIAHQAGHPPLAAHPDQSSRCKKASKSRKKYCAMMVTLDDVIGDLYATLQRLNMWQNTLLVLTSDSGSMAPIRGYDEATGLPLSPGSAGSNYPYRGSKSTLFEGGVRGVAMVSGGALDSEARNKFYDGLAHAVDVPVFILSAIYSRSRVLTAASQRKLEQSLKAMDGSPLLDLIFPSSSSPMMMMSERQRTRNEFLRHMKIPRTEIPLNVVSSGFDFTAIRFGRWKLIVGSSSIYRTGDGWWPPSAEGDPQLPKPEKSKVFSPYKLFDLIADPLEKVNMRNFSEVIKEGRARIRAITGSADFVEPQFNAFHPFALPFLHSGAWAPFLGEDADWALDPLNRQHQQAEPIVTVA